MSSDSKVDARHADGDDEFENLPADEKKEEEELKEPKVYDAKQKPVPTTVVWLNIASCVLLGAAVYVLLQLTAASTITSASQLPSLYHRNEMGLMLIFTLCIIAVVLSTESFAAMAHHATMETLHAHRLETYRLHRELRATRAKKHKKD
jgi:hypothetical protein